MKKKLITLCLCFIFVLCTSCSNNNDKPINNSPSENMPYSRNYEYDFEGKYWITEDKEIYYFNNVQYVYIKNGEFATGQYLIRENFMEIISCMIYSDGVYKNFHLPLGGSSQHGGIPPKYKYENNSLIFTNKLPLNNDEQITELTEITVDEFKAKTGMTLSFTSIPQNSYWVSTNEAYIYHFDDSTLTIYDLFFKSKVQQEYSVDDNVITFEPTMTIAKINGESSTQESSANDLEIKYSLINDCLAFESKRSNVTGVNYQLEEDDAIAFIEQIFNN